MLLQIDNYILLQSQIQCVMNILNIEYSRLKEAAIYEIKNKNKNIDFDIENQLLLMSTEQYEDMIDIDNLQTLIHNVYYNTHLENKYKKFYEILQELGLYNTELIYHIVKDYYDMLICLDETIYYNKENEKTIRSIISSIEDIFEYKLL
jgi:hypothetical protein